MSIIVVLEVAVSTETHQHIGGVYGIQMREVDLDVRDVRVFVRGTFGRNLCPAHPISLGRFGNN